MNIFDKGTFRTFLTQKIRSEDAYSEAAREKDVLEYHMREILVL